MTSGSDVGDRRERTQRGLDVAVLSPVAGPAERQRVAVPEPSQHEPAADHLVVDEIDLPGRAPVGDVRVVLELQLAWPERPRQVHAELLLRERLAQDEVRLGQRDERRRPVVDVPDAVRREPVPGPDREPVGRRVVDVRALEHDAAPGDLSPPSGRAVGVLDGRAGAVERLAGDADRVVAVGVVGEADLGQRPPAFDGTRVDEQVDVAQHEGGRAALDDRLEPGVRRVPHVLEAHVREAVDLQPVLVRVGVDGRGRCGAVACCTAWSALRSSTCFWRASRRALRAALSSGAPAGAATLPAVGVDVVVLAGGGVAAAGELPAASARALSSGRDREAQNGCRRREGARDDRLSAQSR